MFRISNMYEIWLRHKTSHSNKNTNILFLHWPLSSFYFILSYQASIYARIALRYALNGAICLPNMLIALHTAGQKWIVVLFRQDKFGNEYYLRAKVHLKIKFWCFFLNIPSKFFKTCPEVTKCVFKKVEMVKLMYRIFICIFRVLIMIVN